MIGNGQSTAAPRPRVSVILPALDEETYLPGALASLAAQQDAPTFETILVDGGSRDRTVKLFRQVTAGGVGEVSIIRSGRPGRAHQMNLGAARARGEILLFLHADTALPPGGLRAAVDLLADPHVPGGGFRLRFRDPGLLLRVIAAWATMRSRLQRIHYGDQALFVRRSVFEALGGFPDLPLFEDLRFARALRRRGGVRTVPLSVETSARRLLEGGVARTALRFAWIKLRHACGADPERLKSEYPDVR